MNTILFRFSLPRWMSFDISPNSLQWMKVWCRFPPGSPLSSHTSCRMQFHRSCIDHCEKDFLVVSFTAVSSRISWLNKGNFLFYQRNIVRWNLLFILESNQMIIEKTAECFSSNFVFQFYSFVNELSTKKNIENPDLVCWNIF